MKVKTAVGLQ